MPKLRQNIITGEWVVIAPERAKRPEDFVKYKKSEKSECPFCEGGVAYKNMIKGAGTKNVYVINNNFPSFTDCGDRVINESEDGFYFSTPSRGAHEVIIVRPHKMEISDMPESLLREIFETYQERLKFHAENTDIEHAMIIHNYGEDAGASLVHPHSQLMASSIVPAYIKKEMENGANYFLKHGGCIFCEMIREEENYKARMICQNKYFSAFAPFAPRFPFEIWIMPYEHKADFTEAEGAEIDALADIYKEVFKKYKNKLDLESYNFYLHSAPYRDQKSRPYYHWHIEIIPKISKWGGYEYGSGTVIDVVSPEGAAKFLNS